MALRAFAKFKLGVSKESAATYLSDCVGDEDCFRRAARPLQWPQTSTDTGVSGFVISSSTSPVRPTSAEKHSAKMHPPAPPSDTTAKGVAQDSARMPPPAPPSDTTAKGVEQGQGRSKSLGHPNFPSPAPRSVKTALVQGTKEHWMDTIKGFCKHAGD